MNEDRENKLCEVVMRQTTYDKETSLNKLREHNHNILEVIREFMGPSKVKKEENKTTNQKVYGEFRKFLDEASIRYNRKKIIEEKRKEFIYQEALKEYKRRQKEANNIVIKEVSSCDISNNDISNN